MIASPMVFKASGGRGLRLPLPLNYSELDTAGQIE